MIFRYKKVSINNKRQSHTQQRRASDFLVSISSAPFHISLVEPKQREIEMEMDISDSEANNTSDEEYLPPSPKRKSNINPSSIEKFLKDASKSKEVTTIADK